MFLDATYCKARIGGGRGKGSGVASQTVVVATGVSADGRRGILGFTVGDNEGAAFRTAFMRSLESRSLHGTQVVISDAHVGLKSVIAAVTVGCPWQRCRVHFLRNVIEHVPKGSTEMVAAAIRRILAQPDAIATMLGRQIPKVEGLVRDVFDEITRFADFPTGHRNQIWSINFLEWVSKQIKHRTDIVVSLLNRAALLRMVGMVLIETHDEWQVTDRRFLPEEPMAQINDRSTDQGKEVAIREVIASCSD